MEAIEIMEVSSATTMEAIEIMELTRVRVDQARKNTRRRYINSSNP